MTAISFYHDPVITRDHRFVRDGNTPAGFLFSATVPDFTPIWSGTMTLDIARHVFPEDRAYVAPNYAHVQAEGFPRGYAAYFVNVRAVTPSTVSMEFTVDWWGTYRTGLRISGSVTRGATGAFGVAARFSPTPAVEVSAIGNFSFSGEPASRRYVPVIVVQCYRDNDWPAADGEPFQLTFVPNWPFTKEDIAGTGTDAAAFQRCMAPPYIGYTYVGSTVPPTVYKVISVVRRQILPYDMIFNGDPAPMYNRNATAYWWAVYSTDPTKDGLTPATAPRTEGVIYRASDGLFSPDAAAPDGYATPLPFWTYSVRPFTGTAPANGAGSRLYLGNRHTRIPLPDVPTSGASGVLATVRVTLTLNNGLLIELDDGDHVTDITALFDAGVVFNNEQEMRYQAGDNRALGAISGGIAAAGQAIGGATMLASGNPLGLLSLAGAAAGAAQVAQSTQFRARETVSGGDSTAVSDVWGRGAGQLDGLLDLVTVSVENANERHTDAVLRGYVVRDPETLADSSMDYALRALSATGAQAYAIRDPVVNVAGTGEFGTGGLGYLLASPDDNLIAEAEGDLSRGVLVVGADVTSIWSVLS